MNRNSFRKIGEELTPNHRNRKQFNKKLISDWEINGEVVSAKPAMPGATPCATASNTSIPQDEAKHYREMIGSKQFLSRYRP